MLAVIIGILGFFTSSQSLSKNPDTIVVSDSVKNRLRQVHADSVGRYVEINRIFIIGNRITRDHIILRELTLKPGTIIHSAELPSILDLDRKKLINTRLFNNVEIRTLELAPQRVDLLVDLDERWYTFPTPIFELSDRNFNEWWQNYDHDFRRVHFGMRLYQFNMRGRNETLRFIGQLGFQRRFEVLYRFPYIDKKQKHGLSVEMGYRETKNLAFRTVGHKYEFAKSDFILRNDRFASLAYSYRKSFYTTHMLQVLFRETDLHDSLKFLNPVYMGNENRHQQYATLSYLLNSDRRDFVAYPLRGYQFSLQASKAGWFQRDDLDKFEASILYSRYFDLKKGFYLSNNTVGYWSSPDDIPYMNYGVLGYQKQFVRGYEVFVIEGPAYFLNKTTFKKRIFSRKYHWADMPVPQFRHIPLAIYLKTYADFAYVENYPAYEATGMNTALTNKWLRGTGFGIDIVGSYDVVLRFEYSFNGEGKNGFFFHVKKEF